MDKEYAFTIKDNRVDCTDYDSFFDVLLDNECIVGVKCSEKDSNGKLHYHGTVTIPKNVYRKKLCPKGCHLKLKEIRSEGDHQYWEEYCYKDNDSQTDTNDNELMKKIKVKLFKQES